MKKSELISALETSRNEFLDQLAEFDEEEMTDIQTSNGWSVKDILAHLAHWEAELIKLLWQFHQGQRPTTVHFTGQTEDEINAQWLSIDRERPLDRILADIHGVRRQTIRRVEAFNEQDLSDTQRYHWLNGESLSQWVVEDTLEHEKEHLNQIIELKAKKGSK